MDRLAAVLAFMGAAIALYDGEYLWAGIAFAIGAFTIITGSRSGKSR